MVVVMHDNIIGMMESWNLGILEYPSEPLNGCLNIVTKTLL